MFSQKEHVLKLEEWYEQVSVHNSKCQKPTYRDDFLYVYQLLIKLCSDIIELYRLFWAITKFLCI